MRLQRDLFRAANVSCPLTAVCGHFPTPPTLACAQWCLTCSSWHSWKELATPLYGTAPIQPLGRQHPDESVLVNASQNFWKPAGYSPTICSKKPGLTSITALQRTTSVHLEVLIPFLGQVGSPLTEYGFSKWLFNC